MLLDAFRALLEPEFEVVATVTDGRAAVDALERLRPDILLLDVGLPLLNGIEVARRARSAVPHQKIVFVTMHTDRIYVDEAFRAGASGYVLKQAAHSELREAIRTVMSGSSFVSAAIPARTLAAPFDDRAEPGDRFGGRLTSRQREVLQLIAEGKAMKEIAAILHISVRTVEFHKNSIMTELGLKSVAEMTRYAIDHGIAVSAGGLKGRVD